MNPELEGLDDSPHWWVYLELVTILKADPALMRSVRYWNTFAEEDQDDPQPPTSDQTPAIFLTPGLDRSRWETAATHASDIRIGFNLYVSGKTARPAWRLWWAVHKALFPGDNASRNAVHNRLCRAAADHGGRNSGIIRMSQPAFADFTQFANFDCVEAVGEIILPLQIPS